MLSKLRKLLAKFLTKMNQTRHLWNVKFTRKSGSTLSNWQRVWITQIANKNYRSCIYKLMGRFKILSFKFLSWTSKLKILSSTTNSTPLRMRIHRWMFLWWINLWQFLILKSITMSRKDSMKMHWDMQMKKDSISTKLHDPNFYKKKTRSSANSNIFFSNTKSTATIRN